MANPASAIKAREQQLARLKAKTNPEGSTQMQPPQLARAKKGKKGSKKGGKK